jgi:uncharacterized protein YraI
MKSNQNMFNKQLLKVGVIIMLIALVLTSCAPAATTVAPTTVPPTAVPPTAVPTEVPPTAVPPVAADPMYYSNAPVSVVPAGVAGGPMVEAAVNTMIMGGPGTNYVAYGALLGGNTAIATGVSQDGQWYAISVPVAPNGIGWVSVLYVLPSNTSGLAVLPTPPVPPTVELIPPAAGEPQTVALTQVYVRNGPGETYPAYGIAQTGKVARVLGKSEDGSWLTVRLNPAVVGLGYGWVATAYTQPSNIDAVPVIAAPTLPPPVVTTPPPAGAATATAIDYVNLRSGPGTNYLLLGTVAPGTTGEVTGKSADGAWWQVKVPTSFYSPGYAWVAADWVYTANTGSVPVVAAPEAPPSDVSTTPPPANSCLLVSQNPADYTSFPTSTGFGVSWVLQNTSSQAWDQSSTDLVYVGAINGQRLHQNYDLYDITQTVAPGANYTVNGNLITPATPGQYGEAWSLVSNGVTVCTFWIIVNAN